MSVILFESKYGDRYIQGPNVEAILAHVLTERINDTYTNGMSVWYEDATELAKSYLDSGDAFRYMMMRKHREYENFHILPVEVIE